MQYINAPRGRAFLSDLAIVNAYGRRHDAIMVLIRIASVQLPTNPTLGEALTTSNITLISSFVLDHFLSVPRAFTFYSSSPSR